MDHSLRKAKIRNAGLRPSTAQVENTIKDVEADFDNTVDTDHRALQSGYC